MKQIRMKNAEGKEYTYPRCSDAEVDARFHEIRMEIDPGLIPVITRIHPLTIGLWTSNLMTMVAEMEIQDV